jgi:sulfoxide reductase heme-binding subunit YedZ
MAATGAERAVRRALRPALWLLVIVPAVWLVVGLFTDGLGADPVEALEHHTGEWTLRFLAASLAVTPLIQITRWGWLIRERRFLGLAAFAYAVMHLSVYIGIDQFFDTAAIVEDVVERLYITLGMLAFLVLVPLAITSTKGWIKRLGGARWNALHRLVYVSVVAGLLHFFWALKKDRSEAIVYIAVFAVLLGWRVVKPLMMRRTNDTRPAV